MQRGLYIAATGMLSAQVHQDVIASNLANVSTNGYKADRVVNESFADELLVRARNGDPIGRLNMGTRVAGTITDFGQGPLRATQAPLDVAIQGDGFFRVRMEDGIVAYTRDGNFTVDQEGYLTTQRGRYVLDAQGLRVNLTRADGTVETSPVVRPDGTVFDQSGTALGQIGISTLEIPSARKVGDNLWVGLETGGLPAQTQLRQGFLEGSGVNGVKEMIGMITTMRSYESSQRVVTAIDMTLDKAVNSVGRVG